MVETKKETWFKEGLRFKCTGCGGCCTGSPGYVWLSEEDITALTNRLKISRDAFLKNYCMKVRGKYSLRDLAPTYDCIFLKDRSSCTVYEDRPKQCKKYPWWDDNLKNERAWKSERSYCEGIDHPEGKLFSEDEITLEQNS